MRLQVEQLEKEKREREARLRVIAKRIDHVERAYRQEERPLLVKDYELQQASEQAKIEEEKTKRRTSVLKAREAERIRQEDIERANREAEEAERNKREGALIA